MEVSDPKKKMDEKNLLLKFAQRVLDRGWPEEEDDGEHRHLRISNPLLPPRLS